MGAWTSPPTIHSCCGNSGPANTPEKFIDGNTGTNWWHSVNELHWIIIDLGESKLVEQVRIWLGTSDNNRWESVDVYVGNNPADLGAAVATGLDFTTQSSWNERDVTDKGGRYIKLDGIDPQDAANELNGIEFEAYLSELPYHVNPDAGDADVADRADVALAIVA